LSVPLKQLIKEKARQLGFIPLNQI